MLTGFVSETAVRAALASVTSGDAVGPTYDPINLATFVDVASGQLVASPLQLSLKVVRGRERRTLVDALDLALAQNGLGLAVGDDSPEGPPLLLALNNNHFVAFFEGEAGVPPELLDLSDVARLDERWAAAIELAASLPNIPGDGEGVRPPVLVALLTTGPGGRGKGPWHELRRGERHEH